MTRSHSPTGAPSRLWTHNREDSEELAARIQNYWAVRGYKIDVGVYSSSQTGEGAAGMGTIYAVRSNMVNGQPPRDPASPIVITPSTKAKAQELEHWAVRQ